VARLKSQFVAAVFPEFRNPALLHCDSSRKTSPTAPFRPTERRSAYYQTQRRATNRLSRLVRAPLGTSGGWKPARCHYHFRAFESRQACARPWSTSSKNVAPTSGARDHGRRRSGASQCICRIPKLLGQALESPRQRDQILSGTNLQWRVDAVREGDFAAIRISAIGFWKLHRKEPEAPFPASSFRGSAARPAAHIKGGRHRACDVGYIVRAHKGRIRVESETGKGSTFTILLKLEASMTRILLVKMTTDLAFSLEDDLKVEGYEVEIAPRTAMRPAGAHAQRLGPITSRHRPPEEGRLRGLPRKACRPGPANRSRPANFICFPPPKGETP